MMANSQVEATVFLCDLLGVDLIEESELPRLLKYIYFSKIITLHCSSLKLILLSQRKKTKENSIK
jgi:hypothetical protein